MSATDSRVRLFAHGEDYLAWDWNNCRTCVKRPTCDLNEAIASACVLDGTVSRDVATRLGAPDDGSPRFWCKELERNGGATP